MLTSFDMLIVGISGNPQQIVELVVGFGSKFKLIPGSTLRSAIYSPNKIFPFAWYIHTVSVFGKKIYLSSFINFKRSTDIILRITRGQWLCRILASAVQDCCCAWGLQSWSWNDFSLHVLLPQAALQVYDLYRMLELKKNHNWMFQKDLWVWV